MPNPTAVILCTCCGIITGIDWNGLTTLLAAHPSHPLVRREELACGVDTLPTLGAWLLETCPDRVVIAACSPRDHEETFRKLLADAGINPWMLQMVNLREQVAWVTDDPDEATTKAARLLTAAINRVQHHEPLTPRIVPVRTDVAIIGAGPAGMQAAITLAGADRRVTLIEREPFIGGYPVRFEEIFPTLECGSCLLEPIMDAILHGHRPAPVNLLTMADVTRIRGGFGNWTLTVRQRPRYVDPDLCIGCMACAEACPIRRPNGWNGSGEIAAVDTPFVGALPALPHIDPARCLKLVGGECDACLAACPVAGALDFTDAERELTVHAGAIIVASGSVERQTIPHPFDGSADLHTAYTFERLLAMNGPTGGALLTSEGVAPSSIAIVHCAGSLDLGEAPYCSGVCCRAALKYAHLASQKAPGAIVTRLVREQSAPGIEAGRQLGNDLSRLVRYGGMAELSVIGAGRGRRIVAAGSGEEVPAEVIVLMRPVVPGEGTSDTAQLLDLETDDAGFVSPLHSLSAPCAAPRKGIYLAGSCRGPGDIREAFASGTAAAGHALSELIEGRDLVVDPCVAVVDGARCSGCRTCLHLCPYGAIRWGEAEGVAEIDDILCRGCGICVAACPAGAICGRGFTREMLRAEMEGVLT